MAEVRVLLKHSDVPLQMDIDTAIKNGAYATAEKHIGTTAQQGIIDMVMQSGLRGRGGAGFPTGKKWSFLPKEAPTRYLVCNCDESEPGAFKDRFLIERDPHQLIEGMILSCYAIGVTQAFIFCRGEYYLGRHRLQKAVDEALARNFLGTKIFGTDVNLDIIVHPSAGAYIAGEETAQLNSLEGFRATPRLKPPFPAIAGLYGKPTIINNVETLCNVVHIVNNGPTWFQQYGTERSRGTKIFQVSGHVQRPGCFEFALGTPLRAVLDAAGGMLPGRKFKACYPGGSSCALLVERDLDIHMDFESLEARRSALGTASVIAMDDTADMVQVALRLMEFYQNESCGKCTPCREGTRWVVQILSRMVQGLGSTADIANIKRICMGMSETSFCPLAVGAAPPVLSAMAEFPEEFQRAIERNPHGHMLPEMPISYPYS
jgi:NADH-quinone oxidoreductase subunit F